MGLGIRGLSLGRQLRAVLAQPRFQRGHKRPRAGGPHGPPALGRHAIDLALNRKQGIDAPYRLDRKWSFLQLGDLKELAACVRPTRCLGDRAGRTTGLVKLPETRVGIGLQDAGVARQKGLRVLTPAIRRVGRRWWPRPTERSVIAN